MDNKSTRDWFTNVAVVAGGVLVITAIAMAFCSATTVSGAAATVATSGTGLLLFATVVLGIQAREASRQAQEQAERAQAAEGEAREKMVESAKRQIAWYDAQLEEARELPFKELMDRARRDIKQRIERANSNIATIVNLSQQLLEEEDPQKGRELHDKLIAELRQRSGEEPTTSSTLRTLLTVLPWASNHMSHPHQRLFPHVIESHLMTIRNNCTRAFDQPVQGALEAYEQEIISLATDVQDHQRGQAWKRKWSKFRYNVNHSLGLFS